MTEILQTEIRTNQTGDKEVRLVVCIFVSIPVMIFFFPIVLQNVITGGDWIKPARDLCIISYNCV